MADHKQVAIEAQSDLKQEISDYLSEYHGGRDTDLDANEAAEHIVSKLAEPRLREMIAQEILRAIVPIQPVGTMHEGENRGLRLAAQIAKGPQQ